MFLAMAAAIVATVIFAVRFVEGCKEMDSKPVKRRRSNDPRIASRYVAHARQELRTPRPEPTPDEIERAKIDSRIHRRHSKLDELADLL